MVDLSGYTFEYPTDTSQLYSPTTYDPNSYFSSFDPLGNYNYGTGVLSGGGTAEQMYYDTQTGQYLTLAQVQQIDPTYQAPVNSYSGTSDVLGSAAGTGGAGAVTPETQFGQYGPGGTGSDAWGQILNNLPGSLGLLGSLGLTGAAAAALFGVGNQPGTATSTETSTPTALSDPRVRALLGTSGTVGSGGTLTGNTGLLGAANQSAQNLQGPTGLLQGQIGAIPQLNPQIQQAIQNNALGFSQGNVPTLNNPQAQQYFGNMLNAQNAAVDYGTTNALSNAIDQLRQRGFAGGSEIFREGAPAAAMGPILAASLLAKNQNLGDINALQLNYATQLPKLGSDLNAAALNAAAIPYNAYNSAVGTQAGISRDVLNSLMNQGQTTTSSAQGASPNLIQTLGQIAPLLGAAGGLASGATANGQNPLSGLYSGFSGLFNGA